MTTTEPDLTETLYPKDFDHDQAADSRVAAPLLFLLIACIAFGVAVFAPAPGSARLAAGVIGALAAFQATYVLLRGEDRKR
jgi:hypothetical protein